jgi:hypothetical protein
VQSALPDNTAQDMLEQVVEEIFYFDRGSGHEIRCLYDVSTDLLRSNYNYTNSIYNSTTRPPPSRWGVPMLNMINQNHRMLDAASVKD